MQKIHAEWYISFSCTIKPAAVFSHDHFSGTQSLSRSFARLGVHAVGRLDGTVQPVDLAHARNAISYIR